jgi:UPF0755 protein
MKRIIIFLLIIIPVLFLAGLVWWNINTKAYSSSEVSQDFLVTKGYGASIIGESLKEQKLIKSALAFKIYVQVNGLQKKIVAGEYQISPSWSISKIAEQLSKGPQELWVTIPEGFRKEEIAEKFIKSLGKVGEDANTFRNEFFTLTKSKEGYLFPDSYIFAKEAKAATVVDKMLTTFDKRVDSVIKAEITKSGYSLEEVITMASLIERETKTDEERPIVAGILYKRIAKGWPLQVDASVQYIIASSVCKSSPQTCTWWPVTSINDRKTKSSFNTYTNRGLPPSPICNPGLSSIKAAVYPVSSDFWFYLHDKDGQIHYAKTIEEHNANVKKYLGQ